MIFFVYDNINILHQNIDGLINKCDIVTVCLEELKNVNKKIDVLCFTEHNMNTDDINLLTIPNYKLAACFSRKNRNGGSCILLRKSLNNKVIDLERHNVPNFIESSAIELLDHKIIIICTYRVPTNNNTSNSFKKFFDILDIILSTVLTKNNKIILCGDFNINILNRCPNTFNFEQLITSYNLRFSVKQPTRLCSGTCIDNIIHNIRRGKTEVIELAVSDHTLKKTCNLEYWYTFWRDYNVENIIKFKNYLQNLNFNDVFLATDPNV